jgi:hypothetical protein
MRRVHEKRRNIAMFLSEKTLSPGHLLRHEVVSWLAGSPFRDRVDLYGAGVGRHVERKDLVLADYGFSIEIENTRMDHYFTEKLIDCFMLGTIPIYWGHPSVGKIFDLNGMLPFLGLGDLEQALAQATPARWNASLPAIQQNFRTAQDYADVHELMQKLVFSRISPP